MSERLLRTAGDPARFFLVPAELELPPGDLLVRSFDGRSHAVAEEELQRYEVSAERAAAHLDAGVGRLFGQVRGAFRGLFGGEPPAERPPEEPPDAEGASAPADFARWLGVTPGEVMVDRDKRRQGRRALLEKAGRLIRPDLSPEDVDAVEARLDRVGEALARDRQRLEAQTDRLADRIEETRPGVEAAVQEAGERLVELGQTALQQLDRLGRQLAARAEAPVEPGPAEHPAGATDTTTGDPPENAPEQALEDAIETGPSAPRPAPADRPTEDDEER